MSGVRPERAPLFVRSYAVCRQLDERRHTAPDAVVVDELRSTARELLVALAHALSFTAERRADLREADRRLLELRLGLRLAADARLLGVGFVRALQTELLHIGAMLGGWQRSLDRTQADHIHAERGARPRAAATASSAAVRTGTTPGGVAPPTATGTRPTTRGTTRVSASSCPPPNPREEVRRDEPGP